MAESGSEPGIDPDRLGIAGESAGGGLAAGVTLLSRDRGGPALCFQYLGVAELALYPGVLHGGIIPRPQWVNESSPTHSRHSVAASGAGADAPPPHPLPHDVSAKGSP
ncbi:alpha/beta hydrolase fold domain-containing protein [Streptomyces sp. NPDC005648]|uniref:alpha/beta hydrolase n=1 Tax=Streptomyces sp. NPDC005648 TaxID=3157044 RepID=UPI0033A00CB7